MSIKKHPKVSPFVGCHVATLPRCPWKRIIMCTAMVSSEWYISLSSFILYRLLDPHLSSSRRSQLNIADPVCGATSGKHNHDKDVAGRHHSARPKTSELGLVPDFCHHLVGGSCAALRDTTDRKPACVRRNESAADECVDPVFSFSSKCTVHSTLGIQDS